MERSPGIRERRKLYLNINQASQESERKQTCETGSGSNPLGSAKCFKVFYCNIQVPELVKGVQQWMMCNTWGINMVLVRVQPWIPNNWEIL